MNSRIRLTCSERSKMLPEISFELPWPPSVNRIYGNTPKDPKKKRYEYDYSLGKYVEKKPRGRFLTTEARAYKKNAVHLIFFSFPKIKYGDKKIEIKIVQFPPKKNAPDRDNPIKIVWDCIEKSGIIDNDRQIVGWEVVEGPAVDIPYWKIWIRPYQRNKEFGIFKEFLNSLPEEQ